MSKRRGLFLPDPDLVGPQDVRGLVGVGVHRRIGGDVSAPESLPAIGTILVGVLGDVETGSVSAVGAVGSVGVFAPSCSPVLRADLCPFVVAEEYAYDQTNQGTDNHTVFFIHLAADEPAKQSQPYAEDVGKQMDRLGLDLRRPAPGADIPDEFDLATAILTEHGLILVFFKRSCWNIHSSRVLSDTWHTY